MGFRTQRQGRARPALRRTRRQAPRTRCPPRAAQPATKAPSANAAPKASTQPAATAPKSATAPKNTTAPKSASTPTNRPTAPAQRDAPTNKTPTAKPQEPASGFGAFLKGIQDKAQGLVKAAKPDLSPQQREAAERMRTMLEPNKLGGQDRTFNFGDVDAVTNGLLQDSSGLGRRAAQQLRSQGQSRKANLVERAMNGERGLFKRIARNQVYQQAPGQIRSELSRGLQEARVDPNTRQAPDRTPRNLSFNEIEQFQRDAKVMQDYQQQLSKRLGLDVQFPGGVSQASIDHLLSGALGVPPGAVIRPLGGD